MRNVLFAKIHPLIAAFFVAVVFFLVVVAAGIYFGAGPLHSTSGATAQAAVAQARHWQVKPGATCAISPSGGVAPSADGGGTAPRILNGALTPQTRQTLQQAMSTVTPPPAAPPAPAVTNAPPSGAGH